MQQLEFQPAFLKIQKIVVIANRNLGDHEFWKLADSGAPSDILLLQNLFYFTFECARLASTLLHPYCPDTANKMKQLLNESCCSLQIDFSKTYQLDYSKKVFLPKVL
jgi:methionyl-tRNA synthetase